MNQTVLETQVEEVAAHAGGLLRSRYGLWTLAGVSFIESALLVPLITDPFLLAYILAHKKAAYRGVIVTTVASILGGLCAYALAFSFYEVIAERYLVGAVGGQFSDIVSQFKDGVFVVTLIGAVTPVPYTLVALGAGFLKANIVLFVAATLLGRGLRYALVGYVTFKFGDQALKMARRNIIFVSLILMVAAFIYFLVH